MAGMRAPSHASTAKAEHLLALLRGSGGVVVAFSGGVDSGVVLAGAVRALGPGRVIAATAVSGSLPADELAAAAGFAADLGVQHLTPATDELNVRGYQANDGDRCYFCKAQLLDVLLPLAAEHNLPSVATGTNADDLRAGFRPGIRAATERGAIRPLADAGLTKPEVRAIARQWSLPLWDKPAAACLSSRIAFGIPISSHRLARIERAERELRTALVSAGLKPRNLRVRDLGECARVEVDAELTPTLAARPELWTDLPGFDLVELDPAGFRSGAMNELLPDPARFR